MRTQVKADRGRVAWRAPRGLARMLLFIAALGVSACGSAQQRRDYDEAVARITAARALFEEKCRTVAGEKIYKRVEGVEGVLLLKVRPLRTDRMLQDPNWEGAAFGIEADGDSFITKFLGYEYSALVDGKPIPGMRGYIATDRRPGGRPGYRWVDVINEKDGKRYRYTGSEKVVGRKDTNAPNVKANMARDPNYDLNVYRYTLDRTLAPDPPPRYAVTYEDHVIPEERALWVASSTVKVIDQQTGEVLGEMLRYAQTVGPATGINPRPWLTAFKCPGDPVGAGAATRKFVDQILIPRPED